MENPGVRNGRFGGWAGPLLVLTFVAASPALAGQARLIEIIYELDLRALDGRPLPTFETDATVDPDGYVLVADPAGGPPILYQALDAPAPKGPETGLWAALRFRDHLAGVGADTKTLEPIAALPYSPDLQSTSAITPTFDITISEVDDGDIVVAVGGVAHRLAPGAPTAIAVGERTVTLDEFADAVLKTYAAAGVPQAGMPSREAVLAEVGPLASGDDGVTFHARVVAVDHGPVALAEVDLATTLDDARRLAREGPYEDALAALETLLDAMPRHAGAARLFHRVLDLVEAGAAPARAVGRIAYPAGQPDDATRTLWAEAHTGFAMFARPDDPGGSAIIAIPVRDGTFAVHLPAGRYRLTVDVPGFEAATLDITLDGETEIDVPLVHRN